MKPQPLEGYTIGVTADLHAQEQIALFTGLGGATVHVPLVRTTIVSPDESLRSSIRRLVTTDVRFMVFPTRLGVATLLDTADAHGDGPALHQTLLRSTVVARTSNVEAELVGRGIEVGWSATSSSTREVAEYIGSNVRAGDRVGVITDSGEEQAVSRSALDSGAIVDQFELYRTAPNTDRARSEWFVHMVCDGQLDAVTFTTSPAVRQFARLAIELDLLDDVLRRCRSDLAVFGKGPVTRETTVEAGLGPSTGPDTSGIGSLVRHVSESVSRRSAILHFADGELRVQGSRVWIDQGDSIELSAREGRLLSLLLRRPGVVWSKAKLHAQVWGSEGGDDHNVEVVVARLRKRINPKGHWIRTVPRRGYALAVS